MSEWSAKNPYHTTTIQNFILNGDESRKETRHIVLNLEGSGLEYKAGDALGVIPTCPPSLVEELLSATNFSGDEEVETHLGSCPLGRPSLTGTRFTAFRRSGSRASGADYQMTQDQ